MKKYLKFISLLVYKVKNSAALILCRVLFVCCCVDALRIFTVIIYIKL